MSRWIPLEIKMDRPLPNKADWVNNMDLFETIEERRSVRDFEEAEISREDLERVVDVSRKAPSGGNIRPREFIAIADPRTLPKLSKIQDPIGEACATVAAVCDPSESDYWLEDMGAAVENMLLAAVAWVITPAG